MAVIFQIRRGSQAPNAKLTEQQVREMRQARAKGELPCEIGKRFGVSGSQVSKITLGKAWCHVQ